MGRKGTGHLMTDADGNRRVRVSMPDGTRPIFDLTKGATEAEAKAEAAALSQIARKGGLKRAPAKPAPKHETCAEWWDRYFDLQTKKGRVTVKDARGRVKNWVLPILKGKVMRLVTPDDLRRVVNRIDEAIESGAIKSKTGDNIWGDVTSAFRAACSSKVTELRIREDNPTEKVEGPESGPDREKPILYPTEIVALLSCEEVPVERRRIYALALYLGARSNELAALQASSFDLEHQQVTIDRQVDRETKDDRQTKTRRVRSFTLEPAVLELLAAMCDDRPRGRLLDMPPDEERAALLRQDLLTAKVTRAALHVENDPLRVPLWFHHLRDTCLTMMAIRGDDPLKIQFRGGHTDFKMTQKYISRAKNLPPNIGVPFPEIPESLLPPILPSDGSDDGSERETEGVPNGIRRRSTSALDGARLPQPSDSGSPDQSGPSKATHSATPNEAESRAPSEGSGTGGERVLVHGDAPGLVRSVAVSGIHLPVVSTFGDAFDSALALGAEVAS
jgi:integrase